MLKNTLSIILTFSVLLALCLIYDFLIKININMEYSFYDIKMAAILYSFYCAFSYCVFIFLRKFIFKNKPKIFYSIATSIICFLILYFYIKNFIGYTSSYTFTRQELIG